MTVSASNNQAGNVSGPGQKKRPRLGGLCRGVAALMLAHAGLCLAADDGGVLPPLSTLAPTTLATTTLSATPATGPVTQPVIASTTGPASDASTQPISVTATAPATGTTVRGGPTTLAATLPSTNPISGGSTYSYSGDRSRRDRYSRRSSEPYPAPRIESSVPLKPIPPKYSVLETRSIFSHVHLKPERLLSGPTTGPSEGSVTVVTTQPTISDLPHPELMFAVRGLAIEDSVNVALIEDANAYRTFKAHVGDAVARGKIKSMTLDTLDYEAGGRVTQLHLGDNFDGQPAMFATTRPAIAIFGAPTTQPGTAPPPGTAYQPAGPPGAGPPPPGSGQPAPVSDSSAAAILERLRQKRQQELNGGR